MAVKHRKYNYKTAILHCFSIDTAANYARIYYFDSINLDSLNSRKHTTYVLPYPSMYFPVVFSDYFKPVKPFTSTCRHILILNLSLVDAYKESKQKRELEAENKSQECRVFYVFIGSFQLKRLGQTNLLVRRKTLKKRKHNLKSRSKMRSTNAYICPRKIGVTLLLIEACKESRQKRLVVKVKDWKYNLKTVTRSETLDLEGAPPS